MSGVNMLVILGALLSNNIFPGFPLFFIRKSRKKLIIRSFKRAKTQERLAFLFQEKIRKIRK